MKRLIAPRPVGIALSSRFCTPEQCEIQFTARTRRRLGPRWWNCTATLPSKAARDYGRRARHRASIARNRGDHAGPPTTGLEPWILHLHICAAPWTGVAMGGRYIFVRVCAFRIRGNGPSGSACPWNSVISVLPVSPDTWTHGNIRPIIDKQVGRWYLPFRIPWPRIVRFTGPDVNPKAWYFRPNVKGGIRFHQED